MPDFKVKFKDSRPDAVFPEESRPGGSYTNSMRYDGAFAIHRDVWGNETAWPAADILEIKKTGGRY